jgi:hypothetical protein
MKSEMSVSRSRFRKTTVCLLKRWALLVLVSASGCATYHPMPITSEAVDAKLQPPDMAELRILASMINHPILPPVEIKPNEGLTPNGAAVLAVLLNPSLRAIRDQRAVSSAQVLDAGLLPDPQLTFSLEVPTGGNTADKVTASLRASTDNAKSPSSQRSMAASPPLWTGSVRSSRTSLCPADTASPSPASTK